MLDHAAVCESRAGLGRYGGVHASVYRGFRVTGWGVNECRRCGKVIRGWSGHLKRHSERGCDRVAVTWATVDVRDQLDNVDGLGGVDRSKCRHCGHVVRRRGNLKYHLAFCKSLPDSVRAVMDHAAVCESRAGLGCYGGLHAAVYRGFRVTGWGMNECRRCGKVVRGWGGQLKQHSERGCAGMAVTWATVDVGGQFEKLDGCDGGDRRKCRHCAKAFRSDYLKYHLAYCKSLPDSVRAVMDHAAVCESRAGLGRYGGVHASVYRGFRVTGWGVNECRRCGKVVRGWGADLKQHSERGCGGVAVTWAKVDVGGHLQNVDGRDSGDKSKCRHCGKVARSSSMKRHLGWCKSLPDSVRAVLDHAAVCESRAGLGRYGGVHASVYRGFRVTGWGVNECRRCGKVIRGWGSELKQHGESGCAGMAVTWATVDVGGQFEKLDGRDSGDGSKCRHCANVVRRKHMEEHLAYCKSLPDSVRAVMDHAAVCESRAGLGRYGGVNAALYRGFRVTGWGVNECRRCGKVVRGWQQRLNSHVNSKGCSASAAAEAEAASATQRNSDAVCNAQAPGAGGSAAADCPQLPNSIHKAAARWGCRYSQHLLSKWPRRPWRPAAPAMQPQSVAAARRSGSTAST